MLYALVCILECEQTSKQINDRFMAAGGWFGANSRLVQIRQRIVQNQIAFLFEKHKFQKIKTQVNQNNLTQEESKAITLLC